MSAHGGFTAGFWYTRPDSGNPWRTLRHVTAEHPTAADAIRAANHARVMLEAEGARATGRTFILTRPTEGATQ